MAYIGTYINHKTQTQQRYYPDPSRPHQRSSKTDRHLQSRDYIPRLYRYIGIYLPTSFENYYFDCTSFYHNRQSSRTFLMNYDRLHVTILNATCFDHNINNICECPVPTHLNHRHVKFTR